MLETRNQQSLVVGDKYIVIMSGAIDHTTLDGSGLLFGSGATGPTGYTGYTGYTGPVNTTFQVDINRYGFLNQTETTMSFNDSTYQLTLLTRFNSLNYSEGMEAQLIALEKKIKQLISLIESAQEKNKGLESRLASSEAQLTKLQSNMKEASLRLEKMMRQLPEDNR